MASAGAARLAGEIGACCDLAEAVGGKQRLNGVSLVVTVFDKQPRAWRQVVRGARDDLAQRVQTIAAGRQRCARFVAQRGQVRVGSRDIRWFAEHEVETGVAKGLPPRARRE